MAKRGLYYREIKVIISEDVNSSGLDVYLEETTEGCTKMSGRISDDDYEKILGIIHRFDRQFESGDEE